MSCLKSVSFFSAQDGSTTLYIFASDFSTHALHELYTGQNQVQGTACWSILAAQFLPESAGNTVSEPRFFKMAGINVFL
jgi:hypothetical protein